MSQINQNLIWPESDDISLQNLIALGRNVFNTPLQRKSDQNLLLKEKKTPGKIRQKPRQLQIHKAC